MYFSNDFVQSDPWCIEFGHIILRAKSAFWHLFKKFRLLLEITVLVTLYFVFTMYKVILVRFALFWVILIFFLTKYVSRYCVGTMFVHIFSLICDRKSFLICIFQRWITQVSRTINLFYPFERTLQLSNTI